MRRSAAQRDFDVFLQENVYDCPTHDDYLNKWGAADLLKLRAVEGYGYVPGLKRK
jgi:hypothetical protein